MGIKLVSLSLRRRCTDYQPDKANCVSCGRCFWYCPPEQVRQGLIETLPVVSQANQTKEKGWRPLHADVEANRALRLNSTRIVTHMTASLECLK